MAIKVENYDFNGIEVKDAIIKVERIFDSSKEGWNSLVSVNIKNEILNLEDKKETIFKKIEEFNFQVDFNKDERGYQTIYKALMLKYGGEEI